MMKLGYRSGKLGKELTTFLEFMTAPATKILDKWFESDVLKATLATDAIIGAKVRLLQKLLQCVVPSMHVRILSDSGVCRAAHSAGVAIDSRICIHSLPPRHG